MVFGTGEHPERAMVFDGKLMLAITEGGRDKVWHL